jgi:hypothetical protein
METTGQRPTKEYIRQVYEIRDEKLVNKVSGRKYTLHGGMVVDPEFGPVRKEILLFVLYFGFDPGVNKLSPGYVLQCLITDRVDRTVKPSSDRFDLAEYIKSAFRYHEDTQEIERVTTGERWSLGGSWKTVMIPVLRKHRSQGIKLSFDEVKRILLDTI